jgi:hypothetical protein
VRLGIDFPVGLQKAVGGTFCLKFIFCALWCFMYILCLIPIIQNEAI